MFPKPAFGANSSGFGSFNTSTTAASPFGGGFKPTTGASAFGAPPAFGANATAQPATGGGLFGSTSTTGGLFGNTTAAPAPAFGNTSGSFGFGPSTSTGGLFASNPNTGLFGGTQNTTAFGAKPAGFGFGNTATTAPASGGLFGAAPAAGTGLFGAQTNTMGGGGLFSNTTGAFGQQQNVTGTAHVKYNPVVGTDVVMKGGASQNINIKHHSITCMKEYENKSLEELRLEDYTAGRKGSTAGVFGGFQQPAENKPLFGGSSEYFKFFLNYMNAVLQNNDYMQFFCHFMSCAFENQKLNNYLAELRNDVEELKVSNSEILNLLKLKVPNAIRELLSMKESGNVNKLNDPVSHDDIVNMSGDFDIAAKSKIASFTKLEDQRGLLLCSFAQSDGSNKTVTIASKDEQDPITANNVIAPGFTFCFKDVHSTKDSNASKEAQHATKAPEASLSGIIESTAPKFDLVIKESSIPTFTFPTSEPTVSTSILRTIESNGSSTLVTKESTETSEIDSNGKQYYTTVSSSYTQKDLTSPLPSQETKDLTKEEIPDLRILPGVKYRFVPNITEAGEDGVKLIAVSSTDKDGSASPIKDSQEQDITSEKKVILESAICKPNNKNFKQVKFTTYPHIFSCSTTSEIKTTSLEPKKMLELSFFAPKTVQLSSDSQSTKDNGNASNEAQPAPKTSEASISGTTETTRPKFDLVTKQSSWRTFTFPAKEPTGSSSLVTKELTDTSEIDSKGKQHDTPSSPSYYTSIDFHTKLTTETKPPSVLAPKETQSSSLIVPKESKAPSVLAPKETQPPSLFVLKRTQSSLFAPKETQSPSLFVPKEKQSSYLIAPKETHPPSLFAPKETQSPSLFVPKEKQSSSLIAPKETHPPSLFAPKETQSPSLFDPKETQSSSLIAQKEAKLTSVLAPKETKSPSLLGPKRTQSSSLFCPRETKSPFLFAPKHSQTSLLPPEDKVIFAPTKPTCSIFDPLPKGPSEATNIFAIKESEGVKDVFAPRKDQQKNNEHNKEANPQNGTICEINKLKTTVENVTYQLNKANETIDMMDESSHKTRELTTNMFLYKNSQKCELKKIHKPKFCLISCDNRNDIFDAAKTSFGYSDITHFIYEDGIKEIIKNIGEKLEKFTTKDYCVIFIGEKDFKATESFAEIVGYIKTELEHIKHTNLIMCLPTLKYGYTYKVTKYNKRVETFNCFLELNNSEHKYVTIMDSNKNIVHFASMYYTNGRINNNALSIIFNDLKKCVKDLSETPTTGVSLKRSGNNLSDRQMYF